MRDPSRKGREQYLFPITIFWVMRTYQEQRERVFEERNGKSKKGFWLLPMRGLNPSFKARS